MFFFVSPYRPIALMLLRMLPLPSFCFAQVVLKKKYMTESLLPPGVPRVTGNEWYQQQVGNGQFGPNAGLKTDATFSKYGVGQVREPKRRNQTEKNIAGAQGFLLLFLSLFLTESAGSEIEAPDPTLVRAFGWGLGPMLPPPPPSIGAIQPPPSRSDCLARPVVVW